MSGRTHSGVFDHGRFIPGVAKQQLQIAASARGRILGYSLSLIRTDVFCFLMLSSLSFDLVLIVHESPDDWQVGTATISNYGIKKYAIVVGSAVK